METSAKDLVSRLVEYREEKERERSLDRCEVLQVGGQSIIISLYQTTIRFAAWPWLGIFSPMASIDGWAVTARDTTPYAYGDQLPMEKMYVTEKFEYYEKALACFEGTLAKYKQA